MGLKVKNMLFKIFFNYMESFELKCKRYWLNLRKIYNFVFFFILMYNFDFKFLLVYIIGKNLKRRVKFYFDFMLFFNM